MKIYMIGVLIIVAVLLMKDSSRSSLSSYGKRHSIICYSGGNEILKTTSSGKIESENKSDGYFFQEESSGKYIAASGDCIIKVLDK